MATLNGDTVELLKHCISGSKMATNSIEQVRKYVQSEELKDRIEKYNGEHIRLGEEIHTILREAGVEDPDPNPVSKAFAWASAEMKMMMDSSDEKVADLMYDGCNMGVKSLYRYLNQYGEASEEAKELTGNLISLESDLMSKLRPYL